MPRNEVEDIDLIEMIYARTAIKELNASFPKKNPVQLYKRWNQMEGSEWMKRNDYFKKIGNINFEKFLKCGTNDNEMCLMPNGVFPGTQFARTKPRIFDVKETGVPDFNSMDIPYTLENAYEDDVCPDLIALDEQPGLLIDVPSCDDTNLAAIYGASII